MENKVVMLNSWNTSNSTITLRPFRRLGIRDAHKYVPKANEIEPPYQKDFRLPGKTLSVVSDTQLYAEYHKLTGKDQNQDGDQEQNQDQDLETEIQHCEKKRRLSQPKNLRQYFSEFTGEDYNPQQPEMSMNGNANEQESLASYFSSFIGEEDNPLEPQVLMQIADNPTEENKPLHTQISMEAIDFEDFIPSYSIGIVNVAYNQLESQNVVNGSSDVDIMPNFLLDESNCRFPLELDDLIEYTGDDDNIDWNFDIDKELDF